MASHQKQAVGIADAIENLRQEMTEAIERGKAQKVRFNVDQVDLELAVEIEREVGGEGKVSFKVFGSGIDLGGKGSLSQAIAHRVKITLKPASDTGPFQVIDEKFQRPK